MGAAQSSLGGLRNDPSTIREAEATYRRILSDLLARRAEVSHLAEQLRKHRIVVDILDPWSASAAIASGVDPYQPILAGVYVSLGLTLKRLYRFSDAIDSFRQALAVYESSVGYSRYKARHTSAITLRCLAAALVKSGRDREAAQAYRDALELVPNDPKISEGLALLLANSPDPQIRDPREALRLARRAIDMRPEDGHIWMALGMAHYRAGEWADAVAALGRAMALRGGGEAPDHLFMAMAQWRLNHRDEARSWYKRGAELMEGPKSRAGLTTRDPEIERIRAEAEALLGLNDLSTVAKDAR